MYNLFQHFLPRSKLWNTRELYHNMTLEQVQQIFGGETSLVSLHQNKYKLSIYL